MKAVCAVDAIPPRALAGGGVSAADAGGKNTGPRRLHTAVLRHRARSRVPACAARDVTHRLCCHTPLVMSHAASLTRPRKQHG